MALPLSSATIGLNTVVNTVWNGMTSLAVATGNAIAKFFGTSSPRIIDSVVATSIATIAAIVMVTGSGIPHADSTGRSRFDSAGSMVKPVSSVVRVIPSCADERCVAVIFSAAIVMTRRVSPRSRRASRSARSRLTSANSLATNSPVPTMSRSPTPSQMRSITASPPPRRRTGSGARYYWEGRPWCRRVYRRTGRAWLNDRAASSGNDRASRAEARIPQRTQERAARTKL